MNDVNEQGDTRDQDDCSAGGTSAPKENGHVIPSRRNQPRAYVALQRDRAHGQAMGSAQPRCRTVAHSFVQNILEDTGKRGDCNQYEPIVFRRNPGGGHTVSYTTGKQHYGLWATKSHLPSLD